MKNNLILALIGMLTVNFSFGQEKETFENETKRFVIKKRAVITQTYSDNEAKSNLKWRKAIAEDSTRTFPIPPPPPPVAAYDFTSHIHFIIMPEWYIQYTIPNDFMHDTIFSRGVRHISKINRADHKESKFDPLQFEIHTVTDAHKIGENDYEITEINKNVRRKIGDYDCYQVKFKGLAPLFKDVELYVTEEIAMDYNPLFNQKELLKDCYPLYMKKYLPEYPNDVYDEYTFYSY